MFRSLFRKTKASQVPEILGLTIGRTITIDPVEMKLLPDDTLIAAPQTTLMICAQGHCDLGEQSHLHRFYPDDDQYLIQIQGGDGANDTRVDELMLWYVYDAHYPSRDSDWAKISKAIGQPQFKLDTPQGPVEFDRVWFDHTTGAEDPMTYWEDVREDRQDSTPRRIFQTAMLYARTLSDGRDEMLLVNMEEPENSERCISYLIGRAVPEHSIST